MRTTHTEICRCDTNYFTAAPPRSKLGAMRVIPVSCLLLALPLLATAKSETTRIEIAHKKRPFVTLSGPATAGQFTVWSGPGTAAGAPGEPGRMTTGEGDFADWTAGSVELPQHKLAIFNVRFFCAAQPEPPPEVVPVNTSHQCYGVRYAIDPETQQGYIQIPPERDKDFPKNTQTIYRGVEGRWYRSSARWEELVRPRINEELLVRPVPYNYWQQQPYIYAPPASHTAVGARPTVTPKAR